MPDKYAIIKEFSKRYGSEPEHLFFCPGRINIIGEHIDYNGGKVMPCAISMGTFLAVSKNTAKRIRFQCLNFPEVAELHLQESYSKAGNQWFNYPLGVIHEFIQNNYPISGLDLLYYGNLPIGAGLSSSASIEVLTAFALSEMFAVDLTKKEIALLSKKVENEFIGVNCGIMDQFAVAFGKKNNAILLDCETLDPEYIPLELGDYILAIINTKKERSLVGSKYNDRFFECGTALKQLKKNLSITTLCDLDLKSFIRNQSLIQDPVIRKRTEHVISENERVKLAAESFKSGDIVSFGKLMYESHRSLKELYEVSCTELNTIIDFCKTFAGCIGARMTGAGFGGCAIALIRNENFDEFEAKISNYYTEKIGYNPEVYKTEIGDGVREISMD